MTNKQNEYQIKYDSHYMECLGQGSLWSASIEFIDHVLVRYNYIIIV